MDCATRTGRFLSTLAAGALLALAAMPLRAEPAADGIVDRQEELPRGLAIVPWKKTRPETLEEGPVRLVEEPLEPIDPEVFRMQLELHSQSESAANR